MSNVEHFCPDCAEQDSSVNRRGFLRTVSAGAAAAVAAGTVPQWIHDAQSAEKRPSSETVVQHLYESLSPKQREAICFAWDHTDDERGLLRTRVAANWHITEPAINDDFFSPDQRHMIRDIFEGIVQPEWHARFDKHLKDDAGGWGNDQNIAIFGQPGKDKFEFVMTGRHMTLRCDGNSTDRVAFGGPIFYGHAASGFNEPSDHRGNVFWPQAVAANRVYEMLDGRQQKQALVERRPQESQVGFRGKDGTFPGIAVSDLSSDQREHLQHVLQILIEPYRQTDRDEVTACLNAQGGLERCHLAFYEQGDIGSDKVWDNWRLEGPSFVWYFRGQPHVHVWVNVADSPTVTLNA